MKALLKDLKKIALLIVGLCLFSGLLILVTGNQKPGQQTYTGWDESDWADMAEDERIRAYEDSVKENRNP